MESTFNGHAVDSFEILGRGKSAFSLSTKNYILGNSNCTEDWNNENFN